MCTISRSPLGPEHSWQALVEEDNSCWGQFNWSKIIPSSMIWYSCQWHPTLNFTSPFIALIHKLLYRRRIYIYHISWLEVVLLGHQQALFFFTCSGKHIHNYIIRPTTYYSIASFECCLKCLYRHNMYIMYYMWYSVASTTNTVLLLEFFFRSISPPCTSFGPLC